MGQNLSSTFPIVITRNGWGCLLIVPLTFMSLGWLYFIYRVWNSSKPLHDDIFFNICMLAVALFGIVVWFFGCRTQYSENITISSWEIRYEKKGFLRKTKKWDELLQNYKGIATKKEIGMARSESGSDTDVEIDLFLVIIIHNSNKRKNIILEKNAENKETQEEIRDHYAKLLKLPKI